MGRFATICALVGVLAIAGCHGEAPSNSSARNHPSAQAKVQSGSYEFNLEQYVIKDGAAINPLEFGKLMSRQEIMFTLYTGGQERGTLETYDFDGNKYPDVMVMHRANGDIDSIVLDPVSAHYETLKQRLGNRVSLYIPPVFKLEHP